MNPNKQKCRKCGKESDKSTISSRGECPDCKRRRDDEDDETSRRLSQQSINIALGDMLNTGIPGGLDMDITTPL